jgi:hypothetical protein
MTAPHPLTVAAARRREPTPEQKIAGLACPDEVDGFCAQLDRMGLLTTDLRQKLATRKAELILKRGKK